MTLVDTSIWIDLLREVRSTATERLRALLLAEDACVAPVIVQEILAGARSEADFERLAAHFLALPMLATSLATHARAGELYARCRWSGATPRSPHDCLIAATAVEHEVPLLAEDRDFEILARIEPRLRLLTG